MMSSSSSSSSSEGAVSRECIRVAPDKQGVARALGEYFEQCVRACTCASSSSPSSSSSSAPITVAVSGGSLPALLAKGLAERESAFDWSRLRWLFADERCVPLDHPDSNYRLLRESLPWAVADEGGATPSPEQQQQQQQRVFTINASLLADPDRAAADYEQRLREGGLCTDGAAPPSSAGSPPACSLPRIDIVLLGMGEDGHTASLFPGHPLARAPEREQQRRRQHADARWVAGVRDSPKPPPRRITLTLPAINCARHVAFVVTGAGKADALRHIFVEHNSRRLPAGMVRPHAGDLAWFVDAEAASKL